jgi:hypothetical protein
VGKGLSPERNNGMERCAYCGEKVGDEGLYVDDEVFCSEECMRDYGAHASDRDSEDIDDDDEGEKVDQEAYDEEEDY